MLNAFAVGPPVTYATYLVSMGVAGHSAASARELHTASKGPDPEGYGEGALVANAQPAKGVSVTKTAIDNPMPMISGFATLMQWDMRTIPRDTSGQSKQICSQRTFGTP
ncbi:hypothetical protein ACWDO0_03605 [Nocardia rhamnosiphila]